MNELIKLYLVVSDPVAAAFALSILLEQFEFIKDKSVPNWKKLGIVALTGIVWQLVAILFGVVVGKVTFEVTLNNLLAAAFAGLTMASGMAVFNYVINLLPPNVRDFILALFGRNVTTTTVTGDNMSVKSTTPASSEAIGALG